LCNPARKKEEAWREEEEVEIDKEEEGFFIIV
jgi:hypothetical protein